MKGLKNYSYVLLAGLVLFMSCTGNQQRKIDENEFCRSVKAFDKSLDELALANEGDDYDAFTKAYNKAAKDFEKMVEYADQLADLQINQSVEAYDRLASKVDRIANNARNDDAVSDIANEINKTAAKIADIQTTVCK